MRRRGIHIQRLGWLRELPSLDPSSDKVDLQVTADIQQADRKSIKPSHLNNKTSAPTDQNDIISLNNDGHTVFSI